MNDSVPGSAIEAIHTSALATDRIPVERYRAFYRGHPAGFGPWVDSVNKEVARRYGVVLMKNGDAYKVATVEQSVRRAEQHGRKMQRQAGYRVDTLTGLLQRTDVDGEARETIRRRRDKAADLATDLQTAARKRKRHLFSP